MKTLCIYHGNCADGFGAALVVRKAIGKENVEFHAGVYQTDPPDCTGRDVVMVDFSYKRPVMERLLAQAKSFTWLDHHKSAIEDCGSLMETMPIQGCLDINHSGAMLAWLHYFPNINPPAIIKHIEDRDLWRFQIDGTREIQAALFSFPYDFDEWETLLDGGLNTCNILRVEGAAIERKHFKDIKEFRAVAERRMKIGGYDVPVLNCAYFWSSDAGHMMAKGEPFSACYWDQPDGRVFSLRSTDEGLDVSAIAKRYGGGGHRNAAGFKIPFERALHTEAVE